jgi:AcrR family transcriptional regulator
MKRARVNIGQIRREQIIEAAVAVIDEKGLQHLSLSEIETKAGMSRGQLTYYFPMKEDILLAVFDRLLQLIHQQVEGGLHGHPCQGGGTGWERMKEFLSFFLLHPPEAKEFDSLQYTFLSQIGHREDFRKRLADLYNQWRMHMASDMTDELRQSGSAVSPQTFATLVQAILHGLAMQRAADPHSYNREEMLSLCLDLLGSYVQRRQPEPHNGRRHTVEPSSPGNGPRRRTAKPRSNGTLKGEA